MKRFNLHVFCLISVIAIAISSIAFYHFSSNFNEKEWKSAHNQPGLVSKRTKMVGSLKHHVYNGMSMVDVINILGPPEFIKLQESWPIHFYDIGMYSGLSIDDQYYSVKYNNNNTVVDTYIGSNE